MVTDLNSQISAASATAAGSGWKSEFVRTNQPPVTKGARRSWS